MPAKPKLPLIHETNSISIFKTPQTIMMQATQRRAEWMIKDQAVIKAKIKRFFCINYRITAIRMNCQY